MKRAKRKIHGFCNLTVLCVQTALLAVFLVVFLHGCKGEDDEVNCVNLLNQKKYSEVASNESCSTYERASAELGMTGFLFANFLAEGAGDNVRAALGIPSSVTAWKTWEGKTHYENARRLSGDTTGDYYENQTRSKEDVEIHYFASVGGLMAQSYVELDKDSDGEVSENERQGFTRIRDEEDPEYGENDFEPAEWIQFVTDKDSPGEKVYLLLTEAETPLCQPKTSSPYYDGIWDGTAPSHGMDSTSCGLIPQPDSATLQQWALAGRGNVSIVGECTVVSKVEQIQNLFLVPADTSAMNAVELSESFISYFASIASDLVALDLETDSDLLKNMNEFSQNVDNGATCTIDSITEVNQIFDLIALSAQDATEDYEDMNVLKANEIPNLSDTDFALPDLSTTYYITYTDPTFGFTQEVPVDLIFSCNNQDDLGARLIFKKDDGYVPYYSDADTGISNTFGTLKEMNFDDEGNMKPDLAGDEIISFKELLCMDE
ncbi:MAG: hypothetical protein GY866_02370 [Proteobacteria bacterium]|nr:hypothetical protein [Pseudomonadota bacterium]